jgi:CBS domain-containing protein/ribosome-associated translation inhibitor RaiA
MKIEDMYVKDVMNPNPIYVEENEVLSKVISKMKEHQIHELPIVDSKKRVVGYIDFEHLMKRRSIPITSKVSTVMIKPPKVMDSTHVIDAIKIMANNGLRAIPVTDESDTLVGLTTRTDFTKALLNAESFTSKPVEEIMVENPVAVLEDSTIYEALEKMRKLDEMSIPVVNEHNHLKGMVHIKDISNALWRDKERPTLGDMHGEKVRQTFLVKDFLSPPVNVLKNDKIKDAIKAMLDLKSHVVAVTDNEGKLIGILTQKDIIEHYASSKAEEMAVVQITGLSEGDAILLDSIYSIIERDLKKMAKFENYKPLSLTLHVEEHVSKTSEIVYVVRAKLITEKKVFYYTDQDANLLALVDRVMDSLHRMVRKEKEKEKELRRFMP